MAVASTFTGAAAAAAPTGELPSTLFAASATPFHATPALPSTPAVPAAHSPTATTPAALITLGPVTEPTTPRLAVVVPQTPGGGPIAGAAALDGRTLGHVLQRDGLGDLPYEGGHGVIIGTDVLDARSDPHLFE